MTGPVQRARRPSFIRSSPAPPVARRRTVYSRTCDQHLPRLVTRRPALGCLLEIVETLVLTLIIFWVIQSFIAQPYRVQQQSMEHTLEPDQYVLVDKLTPRFGPTSAATSSCSTRRRTGSSSRASRTSSG